MGSDTKQFSTFYIAGRLYGIDVMKVQEITHALPVTRVPLAPVYVRGLINLRGQISTAISLKEMFKISNDKSTSEMNVVCRVKDVLVSFVVDSIGDVLELSDAQFEQAPDTISSEIKKYISGVYKIPRNLLSILDVDRVVESIIDAGKSKKIGNTEQGI